MNMTVKKIVFGVGIFFVFMILIKLVGFIAKILFPIAAIIIAIFIVYKFFHRNKQI